MEKADSAEDVALHHPLFGEALADGTLFIPVSGRDENGEIWDGAAYVTPEDSHYEEWAEIIHNKGVYLAAERELRQVERDTRIEAGRLKRNAG